MDVTRFLDELGYPKSTGFLPVAGGDFDLSSLADYGHIFRQAAARPCSLQGVYSLRAAPDQSTAPIVPIVYFCKAHTKAEADTIHRLVWNQDVVPFLLVHTPSGIRVYSGFRYDASQEGAERGVLRALTGFNDAQEIIEYFHAEAIDTGRLWKSLGSEVTPDKRVDWKLLRSLRALDRWLQGKGRLEKDVSHALIGKYVYLHYLRDRNILSQRKLASWGIRESDVFGRHAQLSSVAELTLRLEGWLNGRIFPVDFETRRGPRQQHLSWVAGAFAGDEVTKGGHRQLSLDFKAYDFSYIPIETLSVIYQQFLHTPGEEEKEDGKGATTKGKEAGAYYTPVPLVNFMLTEMEDRSPLEKGTAVFDPSCGSGAFLVQCYRRLIEKEMSRARRRLRPTELRSLLTRHILGVDRDPDACSITELSLVLTLLDYVEPPDLENTTFQLPALRGTSVFHGDFFEDGAPWQRKLARQKKAWIVGNPPWVKLSPAKLRDEDLPAWEWMTKDRRPIGENQIAQAFAWRVRDYLGQVGHAALLLPAMTLFEARSEGFRSAFFERMKVDAVANFANLAEVLFAGRSRVPAAAFFYRPRSDTDAASQPNETIAAYSPLVANQEATRPLSEGTRNESWSLVVNSSEVRNIALSEIIHGSGLPWKLAAWGSQLDVQLLNKLEHRFETLATLEKRRKILVASQGPELKKKFIKEGLERTKICAEVVGKKKLDMNRLREDWHIFDFPAKALRDNDSHYIRCRGGEKGLTVCRPPHVIVNAARRFAVFSDEYIIVPPRQIGIVSDSKDCPLLKALALFLSSDFAFYHQFLTSAQFGVKRDVATLAALRSMPVPLTKLPRHELKKWEALHARLVAASRDGLRGPRKQTSLFGDSSRNLATLMEELNEMTSAALGLDRRERALVHDLVRVRLELNDGKLGRAAIRPPERGEARKYAQCLKRELDVFVGTSLPRKHAVSVIHDELSGMVALDFVEGTSVARKVTVASADDSTTAALAETRRRLLEKQSQWVYFNRNLRIYEGTRTFIFKPWQRFHWTQSQALFDAREVIAETLSGGDAC